ncbi:sucrase ferredoxin [Saccharospirillum sp. HFRX-1]|uniref:sucrase ferredoxin n=1 Tax=unclassified Saccharospirillum TaxID=2633430 RepID=UPI003717C5E2
MTQFCAQYSQEVGEPLPGTAAHLPNNLLLSWPIGDWTRTYHQAKSMTPEVSDQIRALVAAGRRVNLIHRADQGGDVHRAYLMPECLAFNVPRGELAAFLDALQQQQSLAPWQVGAVHSRILLCCTHGVKDKCCAKFGNAAFKALDQAAQAYDDAFEIWQSSHLGGCRLASSALMFPALRKYGRIEPEQAGALLQAELADQPYLPNYRGDGRLSPAQQVADVAAREHLQSAGTVPLNIELTELPASRAGGLDFHAHWQSVSAEGALYVQLEAITSVRYGTCADIDEGLPPAVYDTWQPVVVEAVS